MGNFSLAWRSFWSLLGSGKLPDEVMDELGIGPKISIPVVSTPASAPKAAAVPVVSIEDGAVRMLALLQREGRLLDFLYEDLTPYTDDRVGAVVRGVHESCRKALDRAVQLGPVIDGVEGTVTTFATTGVNPKDSARVKLMGNVPPDGKPASGILQHKGWLIKGLTLPSEDAASKARVLSPAEIEVE